MENKTTHKAKRANMERLNERVCIYIYINVIIFAIYFPRDFSPLAKHNIKKFMAIHHKP